jgi:hypothetical protein
MPYGLPHSEIDEETNNEKDRGHNQAV